MTGVGLIAWRGDRLRSPGGIDSPVSREGAFLLNNLLFVAFAFVVLLGTVFPLLYEALRGPAGHRGRALLQRHDPAHRPGPALPHGDRPGTAVAQDDRGHAARPAGGAGLGGRCSWSVACVAAGVRGLGAARSPSASAGSRRRPTCASSCSSARGAHRQRRRRVAGPRGAGQRRHGGPPRRGGDRRGPGRGHLVRPPRRGDAAPGHVDRRSTATGSRSRA